MIGDITSWCGIEGPEKISSSTSKTDRWTSLKEKIDELCMQLGLKDDDVIAVRMDKGAILTSVDNFQRVVARAASSSLDGRFFGITLDPISGFTLTSLQHSTALIFIASAEYKDTPIYLILGVSEDLKYYYGEKRVDINDELEATYLTKKQLYEELDSYNYES